MSLTTLSAITVFDEPCVVTARHDADAAGDVTVPVIPAGTAATQVMMNAPPVSPAHRHASLSTQPELEPTWQPVGQLEFSVDPPVKGLL